MRPIPPASQATPSDVMRGLCEVSRDVMDELQRAETMRMKMLERAGQRVTINVRNSAIGGQGGRHHLITNIWVLERSSVWSALPIH